MTIPDLSNAETSPAWCPGCGNFALLKAFDAAMAEAGLDPKQTALVSGIGQAAKLPHYTKANCNVFNGLHGRALPAATGIKIANHKLNVIITSGDGDMYGEGGNHLMHAIRRNISIKTFVHNNQVYGLTKGQASPTSDQGMTTKSQPKGVTSVPFNPLAAAIVQGCSFVARSFTGTAEHLIQMMLAAMQHEGGFALLDILQPCITFNRVNTFKWYKERVKPIDQTHDPFDRSAALALAFKWGDEIPVGIFYRNDRPTFEANHPALSAQSLVERYASPA